MLNLVDINKLYEAIEPECRPALLVASRKIPCEEKFYSVDDMDYLMKINFALVSRFKDQLYEEFGASPMEVYNMFQILYKKQNDLMPDKWYEYGCGLKE